MLPDFNKDHVDDNADSQTPASSDGLQNDFIDDLAIKQKDAAKSKAPQENIANESNYPKLLRGNQSTLAEKLDDILSDQNNLDLLDNLAKDIRSDKKNGPIFVKLANKILLNKIHKLAQHLQSLDKNADLLAKDPKLLGESAKFLAKNPKLLAKLINKSALDINDLAFLDREFSPKLTNKDYRDALVSIARDELHKGTYGEVASKVYSAYIDSKNTEINNIATQLIDRKIKLPPRCPIEVQKNKGGELQNDKEFLQSILDSKAVCALPAHKGPLSNENVPGLTDINQLKQAEDWLQKAKNKLEAAESRDSLRLFKETVTRIFKGHPPAGLLPGTELNDRAAKAFVDKSMPYLDLMLKAEDCGKAIVAFEQLAESSGIRSPLGALAVNLPGYIERDDAGKIVGIHFDYPDSFEGQLNHEKMRVLEEWLANSGEKASQAALECFRADKRLDRVCYWGDVPMHGIDEETKQEYNYVKYRYQADLVNVDITHPDGSKGTQERVRVTTRAQREWRTPISYHGKGYTYNVGKPVVSGYASIDGQHLPPNETLYITGKGNIVKTATAPRAHEASTMKAKASSKNKADAVCAQVRLGKNGNIQVLALKGPAHVFVSGADSNSQLLAQNTADSDQWIDLLPGYTLAVGQTVDSSRKLETKNDTRLYHPDDLVAVRGNGHLQPLLAKDLPGQIVINESKDFLDFAVPLAMDAAFIAMGVSEFRAVYLAMREVEGVLAERAVAEVIANLGMREGTKVALSAQAELAMAALESGALTAAKWSWKKHLFLGLGGPLQQLVENQGNAYGRAHGLGENFGHRLNQIRSALMTIDIASGATPDKIPLVSNLSKWWGSVAHADQTLMNGVLGAESLLTQSRGLASNVMSAAMLYYVPDTFLGIGDDFKKYLQKQNTCRSIRTSKSGHNDRPVKESRMGATSC